MRKKNHLLFDQGKTISGQRTISEHQGILLEYVGANVLQAFIVAYIALVDSWKRCLCGNCIQDATVSPISLEDFGEKRSTSSDPVSKPFHLYLHQFFMFLFLLVYPFSSLLTF